MRYLSLILLLNCLACASSPVEKKQKDVLLCIKDLKSNDISSKDAFRICAKVYNLGSK